MSTDAPDFNRLLDDTFGIFDGVLDKHAPQLAPVEVGKITAVSRSVALVSGLPNVQSEELLRFPGNVLGMAFNLDPDEIGVVLLDESERLSAGDEARRTSRVLDVPVGEELLGRILDPVGRPRDRLGPIPAALRRPCERPAPAIMDRDPVQIPLQTGLKVVDALVPVGRGQRELILGDRQTGKTAIALDTIINQHDTGVICIYCAIAQRTSAVARVIAELKEREALDRCVVVVAEGNAPPGLQYIAPYAATTIGEYFMEQGQDVLVIYDDLTAHARAYRELSLLLRRPPGREAFPGDIFYVHSRLLERATHLRDEVGGGSLTALPVAETEAQNVSAYIPTNLISITDGQIYLSPDLFQKGQLPAVEVGRSVSRVGGKAQLPAYRAVAGDLRLSYSQFEELEAFSRFGSRLDDETRQTLERGRRVREVFKQPQGEPLPVAEQIAVLVAVTRGIFDPVPIDSIADASQAVRDAMTDRQPDLCRAIVDGQKLKEDQLQAIEQLAREAVADFVDDAAADSMR
ncbi:ATP synthase subunit alpha [Maioricimonas rarisocia]|uniref:ATP synthase subunit alpha n=1 Tax=Maioricimonas rarisocia TaxID=2528026 RepID=A0A517Z9B6_9PLAN|nr:alternate F1F0 ATPase, F1 subunit alpha [Maioricimonas rarisocia]QDU39039.1 ATP synthase subunit alpha [Maioricimonas rarisocia]